MFNKGKKYILNKLGITKLKEEGKNLRKKNEEIENQIKYLEQERNELGKRTSQQENQIKILKREKYELMKRVDQLENQLVMHWGGLNKEERQPRVIVSLTSFPERIPYVAKVLENMLLQTMKADKIILWLSKEQFPNRESDLPEGLLKMKSYGIEIEWCDGDIKAYKKSVPVLKKYADDIVIIIDDDLVYDVDLVEKLYLAHKQFPNAIIASRCHEIKLDENDRIESYSVWTRECNYDTYQLKNNWFFTGGAGTLLPPHCFDEKFFDTEIIQQLCPWADDVWMNIHAAVNRVSIINTAANNNLTRIEATQKKRLEDINLAQNQNDIQMKNVVAYYKEQLNGTIYEKL